MFVIDPPLRFPHNASMATTDDVYNELMRRLETKALKGKDVAALLGTHPSRISEMKRSARSLKAREVDILARFFGIANVQEDVEDDGIAWVPVIGIASAGSWKEAISIPAYTVPMKREANVRMSFAVEVHGDSMDRVIPDGGWAVIDTEQRRLYDGRVYLISNHEFDGSVKRYKSNPARFEPDSHNPDHQPIFMDEHSIRVIGRVVAFGGSRGL